MKTKTRQAVRGARIAADLGGPFWDELAQHLVAKGVIPAAEPTTPPAPEEPLVRKRPTRD